MCITRLTEPGEGELSEESKTEVDGLKTTKLMYEGRTEETPPDQSVTINFMVSKDYCTKKRENGKWFCCHNLGVKKKKKIYIKNFFVKLFNLEQLNSLSETALWRKIYCMMHYYGDDFVTVSSC